MAKNRAVSLALDLVRSENREPPQGLAILASGLNLDPRFIETCGGLLADQPCVGLVSGWAWHVDGSLHAPAQPSFPYQFMHNEVGPAAVVRREAFVSVGGFRESIEDGFEDWDVFNAVMANGWIAVTAPVVFATGVKRTIASTADERVPQRVLLERFPELVARDAFDFAILAAAAITRTAAEPDAWRPPTLRDVLGFAARHPIQTVVRLRERIGEAVRLRAQNRRSSDASTDAPTQDARSIQPGVPVSDGDDRRDGSKPLSS